MASECFKRYSLTLGSSRTSAGEGSAWARPLAEASGFPGARVDALDLCIIEMVSNIVAHAYRGQPGEIRLELDIGQAEAILRIFDDGPAFDPMSVPPPDLPASLDDAKIGGFGIHLVRISADACEYERREDRNVFTARFRTIAERQGTRTA